jgi:hypothetical protein
LTYINAGRVGPLYENSNFNEISRSRMAAITDIRWFRDIRLADVALVGGKNASLGELYSALSEQAVSRMGSR